MRHLRLLTLFILLLLTCTLVASASGSKEDRAKIIFVSKEGDNVKTYVGSLKKGDLTSLKYELQRYNSGNANEIDVPTEKGSLEGYVEQITVLGEKKTNRKKLKKAIKDDLIGNYEIPDEKTLLDVKVKKLKKIEAREAKKNETGNFKKYKETKYRKKPSQLSNYFKISKEKRLRNRSSFTKPAGGVTLFISYMVQEGKNMNTYLNVVEGYLKPNSTYNLKYHGTNSRRQYYLEYVPDKKQ